MTSVTFKDNAGNVTKRVSYVYDVFDRWIAVSNTFLRNTIAVCS
jgi:hypothetical protein